MNIQKGWIQIEPIQKSNFDKSFIVGKATCNNGQFVYFAGTPVVADDKYFIKQEQVIAL
jgi:hypothetical protein